MKWWLQQWNRTIREGAFLPGTWPASLSFCYSRWSWCLSSNVTWRAAWPSPQRDLSSTSLPEVSFLGRIMDHSYKTDFSSFEPESLFAIELLHHDLNYLFLLRHIQSLYFHRIIFEAKLPEFRKPLNNEIAIISMPDTVLASLCIISCTPHNCMKEVLLSSVCWMTRLILRALRKWTWCHMLIVGLALSSLLLSTALYGPLFLK